MWWSLASFESNSWVLPHFYLTSIFWISMNSISMSLVMGQRELAHSLQKSPPTTSNQTKNHDLQICIRFALQRHFFHTFLSVFLCRWQGFTPNNPRLMKSQEGPHRKWRRSVTEKRKKWSPLGWAPGCCGTNLEPVSLSSMLGASTLQDKAISNQNRGHLSHLNLGFQESDTQKLWHPHPKEAFL